jgi:hypothetical protein
MPRPSPARRGAPAAAAELSPSGPYRAVKQAGLVALCAAWVLLGLVGHDPWKIEDATSFGIAWEMLQGGNPLVPTLAGEPYVDRPPLVYAIGALSGRACGGVLPVHDAVRIAVGTMLALTLLFEVLPYLEELARGLLYRAAERPR